MKRAWFSALLAIATAAAAAQAPGSDAVAGNGLEATAYTIDGGGGRSQGGNYILTGTVGQGDAEPQHPATGSSYSLVSGFLPAARAELPEVDALFADGFEG